MIYPPSFPVDKKGHPEEYVYNFLKSVANEYDIFYDRGFSAITKNEKRDYQIDFIIAKPYKAILIVEVKGGVGISFKGETRQWLKNGKAFKDSPVDQVVGYWTNLISRYDGLSKIIPFQWALCFPESEKNDRFQLPNEVSNNKVIDRLELNFIGDKLKSIFDEIEANYTQRDSLDRVKEYDKFKSSLIRDYGFVQTLSTQFIEEENKYVELTDKQKIIFRAVKKAKHLFVRGVAGSGKTLIAMNIAHQAIQDNKSVLFLCFNRTLANVISHQFSSGSSICINTFHSYAEDRVAEFEPGWFELNNKGENNWFEEDVPLKLSEAQDAQPKSYDLIIIDEGQDFMQLWFEVVFQELNPEGKIIVFADFDQDIFGRFDKFPLKDAFELELDENCRNTKAITSFVNKSLGKSIENMEGTPDGEEVEEECFSSFTDMIKQTGEKIANLIDNEKITTNQIIIIVNKSLSSTKLQEFKSVGKFELQELDKEANFSERIIYYTTSSRFKGLDSDVVFVLNEPVASEEDTLRENKRYVRITRAKHKLFYYTVSE